MELDENLLPEPPPLPQKTWVDRMQALFEVILLAGLASSLLAGLPFMFSPAGRESLLANVRAMSIYLLLEAAITFVLLLLVMKAHGETIQGLGLSWLRWRSDVILGLAIVPLLFTLNIVVSVIFQAFFPKLFLERNPLTDLIRGPGDLGLFIGTALIAGGIKEEVQRAFIVRRFQAYLGGANLGLVLWSVAFGIGHYVQGVQGMIAAGIFGLIFGIAYLARGNLIAPMVAHGAYDTLALLGYWLFSSHH
jgi:membrane protease YdiL (CAAX protease family)